jgi:DNA replication protein DnaC
MPLADENRLRECAQSCGEKVVETYRMAGGSGFWVADWGGPNCPACEEKVRARAEEIERAKVEKENRVRLTLMIGGPQPFEEMTIERAMETFAPTKREAVLAAKGFNPLTDNLYFYGPVGTGKSHLAMAIAIEQCNRGRSVAYFTPRSLNREFRRFQLDADKERKFLRFLWLVDVFVLDEVGIGNATEFALESLQEIIDGRKKNYKNGAVFTSNLNLDQLAAHFQSERISDRLFGNCQQIFVSGESYRGRK